MIAILFLAGCAVEEIEKPATVVCNAPYIRHADDCCLDQNNNKICDEDETIEPIIEQPAPIIEQSKPEIIKTRTIESCTLNDELECMGATINESGILLQLKNNMGNKANFHRIDFRTICTKTFDIFIQPGETVNLLMNCVIEDSVSKIYYDVSYDEYGVEQNREETGIIQLGFLT